MSGLGTVRRENIPASTCMTLFCGGQGAETLLRRLVRTKGLKLSLVVNGYDNGFSTGALRRHIPGLLGPSDFRKNVRHHLDPEVPHDRALLAILDHRLGTRDPANELAAVREALGAEGGTVEPWVVLESLLPTERSELAAGLDAFLGLRGDGPFDLADCSVANLVFAGLYLRCNRDFNATVAGFGALFGSPIRTLNVTNGENAFLTATKDDEVLIDEADVVAAQSPAPIRRLDLLHDPVTDDQAEMLNHATSTQRREWLRTRRAAISLNPQAAAAVEEAEIVVFCAGTQFSSLLPSYLTPGLGRVVAMSQAPVKVLLINIHRDFDIQQLDADDVLDEALCALGDPENARRTVTHVLFHNGPGARLLPERNSRSQPSNPRNALWVGRDLEDPQQPGVHDGRRTVAALAELYECSRPAPALAKRW